MGRGLEALNSVPAGVVCGIAGLGGYVLKTGTLCSQVEGAVNLAGLRMGNQPIVRVALEPANPADLDRMIRGMKLLEQSDACAQYEVLESGEHVILTAGELHLERCLKDLRERFAKCDIQAGEPIVPYRETIVSATEMAAPKEKELPRGTVVSVISSKQVNIRLRVRPLPAPVNDFLQRNISAIRHLYAEQKAQEKRVRRMDAGSQDHDGSQDFDVGIEGAEQAEGMLSVLDFREKLRSVFAEVKGQENIWANAVQNVAAFGPRRDRPKHADRCNAGECMPEVVSVATRSQPVNLIISSYMCLSNHHPSLQEAQVTSNTAEGPRATRNISSNGLNPQDLSDKIAHAFQLATAQGPLCHEPVQGIAVFLEKITINQDPSQEMTNSQIRGSTTTNESIGRLTGE